jgi:hypothetical protein
MTWYAVIFIINGFEFAEIHIKAKDTDYLHEFINRFYPSCKFYYYEINKP